MYKFKILGAGSIGNHLAHAARCMGWDVALCDTDPAALERTRDELYPARYGAWDEAIGLHLVADAPRQGHDLIAIGTPPEVHVELAIDALEEKPRAILVEKPVCGPDLHRAEELRRRAAAQGVSVFVGYDHVVGEAPVAATAALQRLAAVDTIDVEFREHWAGIFAAHPWLDGPRDTYLGYSHRGGGASGEHSHATNLWQHFARAAGAGEVVEVTATLDYVRDGEVEYDRICLLNLRTECGMVGRVVQDVVTHPPRKRARIQGSDGYVELAVGFEPGMDRVEWQIGKADPECLVVEKTRPDDFIRELEHVQLALESGEGSDVIDLDRGLDTMLVVAAAHRSAAEARTVRIDRAAGCSPDALRPV